MTVGKIPTRTATMFVNNQYIFDLALLIKMLLKLPKNLYLLILNLVRQL